MLKQKEWIDVIVAKTGCTKKEAKIFYDCTFDYMREQISIDESIKISGFGVLKLRRTAAKEQINVITGVPEIVPEHNVITFKPYFEIDPKPDPIDVVIEDGGEEVAPVVEEPVTQEVVEEVVEEEVEEVQAEPAVEEVVEVVEEPAPVKEEPVATEPEDDGFRWKYNDSSNPDTSNPYKTTAEMKHVLQQRTSLSDADIDNALNVVKENLTKQGKTECEVKEENETFNFICVK